MRLVPRDLDAVLLRAVVEGFLAVHPHLDPRRGEAQGQRDGWAWQGVLAVPLAAGARPWRCLRRGLLPFRQARPRGGGLPGRRARRRCPDRAQAPGERGASCPFSGAGWVGSARHLACGGRTAGRRCHTGFLLAQGLACQKQGARCHGHQDGEHGSADDPAAHALAPLQGGAARSARHGCPARKRARDSTARAPARGVWPPVRARRTRPAPKPSEE
jgi:hypothetical protein